MTSILKSGFFYFRNCQFIVEMNHLLSDEQIAQILQNPKVLEARDQLAEGHQLYFTSELPESVQHSLQDAWGIPVGSDVPMRWIQGDTPAHVDSGRSAFEQTHLVYLTDSEGEFVIGDASYPITKGAAFTFQHGVRHETRGTGSEPRLLIGPMSEQGFPVGSQVLYYNNQASAIAGGGDLIAQGDSFTIGVLSTGSITPFTSWFVYNPSGPTTTGPFSNGYVLPAGPNYFLYPANVPCFPAGTRILTAEGYKVVESLTTEDRVQTADGRHVRPTLYKIPVQKATVDTAPYRIEAGSLALNYPPTDLCLSPLHAVLDPTGTWHIPQLSAKDNDKLTQYGVGEPITYYHIECPDFYSDNLIAEGAVVESYKGRQGVRDVVYEWVEDLKGFRRLPKEERRSVSKKENTLVVY